MVAVVSSAIVMLMTPFVGVGIVGAMFKVRVSLETDGRSMALAECPVRLITAPEESLHVKVAVNVDPLLA